MPKTEKVRTQLMKLSDPSDTRKIGPPCLTKQKACQDIAGMGRISSKAWINESNV